MGKFLERSPVETLTLFSDFDELHKELSKVERIKMHKDFGSYAEGMEETNMPVLPADEDYAFFPFRHISKTTVGAGTFQATDFSKGNILKDSVPLLSRKPAYTNHIIHVGSEIGILGEASWQNKSTNAKGEEIPAGINAPFVIDKKIFPQLVRKLNSPHGSPIDSASVTVAFMWEPSHDFEEPTDFYWHLGEMIDDKMVRRIAAEIMHYQESSMVWSGADPYAKYLDDKGYVPNPDVFRSIEKGKFANDQQAKEAWYKEFLQKRHYYCLDSTVVNRVKHFNESIQNYALSREQGRTQKEHFSNSKQKTSLTMDEKLKILLAARMGVSTDELSEDLLKSFEFMKKTEKQSLEKQVQQNAVLEAKVESLEQEKNRLTTKIQALETEQTANKEFVEFGKKNLEHRRQEAKELYTKFSNGEPSDSILKSIEKWDLEVLEASMEAWGGSLLEKYGAQVVNGKVKFTKSQKDNSGQQKHLIDTEYRPFGFP